MTNPNNCQECDHHKMQRSIELQDPTAMKLHCYMFKDEPKDVCMQHSERRNFGLNSSIQGNFALLLSIAAGLKLPEDFDFGKGLQDGDL